MDIKLTLSFDESVIKKAKQFATQHHISLSRLVEFLLLRATSERYASLEEMPVSEWVLRVSEGEAVYKRKKVSRREMRNEYYASKK